MHKSQIFIEDGMWHCVIPSQSLESSGLRKFLKYSLTTQRHIPEEWTLQKYRCESLKCRNSFLTRQFIATEVEKASLHKHKPIRILNYRYLCCWRTKMNIAVRLLSSRIGKWNAFWDKGHEKLDLYGPVLRSEENRYCQSCYFHQDIM